MSTIRLSKCLFFLRQPALVRTFVATPCRRSESIILPRLKSDLKDAMRAKDKPRLDILRSIMAEITNASKTAKPITSDAHLLALLTKQLASSDKSLEDFRNAKRDDLVEKEEKQRHVLKGYVEEIPKVKPGEVDVLVAEVVRELSGGQDGDAEKKPAFGLVMKGVLMKIAGQPVDQGYVSKKVEEMCGKSGKK